MTGNYGERVHLAWPRDEPRKLHAWWIHDKGYTIVRLPGWRHKRSGSLRAPTEVRQQLELALKIPPECIEQVTPSLGMARFHPRIERNVRGLQREHFREAWLATAAPTTLLLNRLAEILNVTHPHSDNLNSYGEATRQLLILACTEVEGAWRAVFRANGVEGRLTTNQYVRLLPLMRLHEWRLQFPIYPHLGTFAPFENWTAAEPTASLDWYDAYNRTKHDRESNLNAATLDVVLKAVSAFLIMNAAQFGAEMAPYPTVAVPFRFTAAPSWEHEEFYVGPTGNHGEAVTVGEIEWRAENAPLSA